AGDGHRVPDAALGVHRFRSVSPQDSHVRKAQGPVDSGAVLDHGSSAEDRPENLGDRSSTRLPFGRQSDDEDVTDALPSSGRMLQRNVRSHQPIANLAAWIPWRPAIGKIEVWLEACAKWGEIEMGLGRDREENGMP